MSFSAASTRVLFVRIPFAPVQFAFFERAFEGLTVKAYGRITAHPRNRFSAYSCLVAHPARGNVFRDRSWRFQFPPQDKQYLIGHRALPTPALAGPHRIRGTQNVAAAEGKPRGGDHVIGFSGFVRAGIRPPISATQRSVLSPLSPFETSAPPKDLVGAPSPGALHRKFKRTGPRRLWNLRRAAPLPCRGFGAPPSDSNFIFKIASAPRYDEDFPRRVTRRSLKQAEAAARAPTPTRPTRPFSERLFQQLVSPDVDRCPKFKLPMGCRLSNVFDNPCQALIWFRFHQ